jgi:hypothetical protein
MIPGPTFFARKETAVRTRPATVFDVAFCGCKCLLVRLMGAIFHGVRDFPGPRATGACQSA